MGILRIKEIMLEKNISRDELAKRVKLSPTSISNICNEASYPKYSKLAVFAKALDVDVRELFYPTKGDVIGKSELEEAKESILNALRILEGKKKK
jgi:transcriptional regulator with XRE-family HTH domain